MAKEASNGNHNSVTKAPPIPSPLRFSNYFQLNCKVKALNTKLWNGVAWKKVSKFSSCWKRLQNPLGRCQKPEHFQRIHTRTRLLFNSMLFFDDEDRNIESVSSMRITSILVDDGINLGAKNFFEKF